jgi:hypothetical protein
MSTCIGMRTTNYNAPISKELQKYSLRGCLVVVFSSGISEKEETYQIRVKLRGR